MDTFKTDTEAKAIADQHLDSMPTSNGIGTHAAISRANRITTKAGLCSEIDIFQRAAVLAIDPAAFLEDMCSDSEREHITRESTHRFQQPWAVWWVSLVGALAATVQGMDETVISGAQLYFLSYFGLEDNPTLIGFVNAAPYLICATVGCWIAIPSNYYLGRRGTICLWCVVSSAASAWQCTTDTWEIFLGSRLLLGVCIGANSATVAVYTAECTPARIRGGLVMMWQVFVAFGIMMGYIMAAAFVTVRQPLNWRLMLGSQLVPPIFVVATVFFGPESPRYLASRGRYAAAFQSLLRLRWSRLQAAKELYCIVEAIELEETLRTGRTFLSDFRDIVKVPRVRYATLSALFIMFMQNFCGINAMTYYTGQIFVDTGASAETAIYASIGAGALLCLTALPAIKFIDIWGRRQLLVGSLVSMGLCTLWTGFSFQASNQTTRLGMVAVGMRVPPSVEDSLDLLMSSRYLYQVAYAPGEGAVSFVYASEVFPMYMRTVGMSLATATTWLLSFSLTLAWPSQLKAMTVTGAFCWYSVWCFLGAIVMYLFLPETKALSLEDLDCIFAMPILTHAQNKLEWLQFRLRMRSERPRDVRELAQEGFAQFRATVRSMEKSDTEQCEIKEHVEVV